jgi:hypothetical protein
MPRKKPRKCRICKKRPVWRGGDVKAPGSVCKQCYHKHVWPERRAAGHAESVEADHVAGSEIDEDENRLEASEDWWTDE